MYNLSKYKESKIVLISIIDNEITKNIWIELMIPIYNYLLNLNYNVSMNNVYSSELIYDDNVIYILFGYHMFNKFPEKYIIYQTEQMARYNTELINYCIDIFKKAIAIFDYSKNNVILFNKYIDNIYYIPISYHSVIDNYKSIKKNNKVLWLGNILDRRKEYLSKLISLNDIIDVYTNNIWGIEKQQLISKYKIYIDISMFDPNLSSVNMFKFQYGFINRCLIITEYINDMYMYEQLKDFVIFVKTPNEMIEKINYYLDIKNENELNIKTHNAYEWFKNTSFSNYLQ